MLKNRSGFIITLLTIVIITSACSSMNSIVEPDTDKLKNGLPYYMPKKDFLVTVTVKEGVESFVASTTPAYPDLSQIFVLKYQDSLIGDNLLTVGIDTHGLLTGINAKTVSQLNQIFKNIARSAGAISTLRTSGTGEPKLDCPNDGTYVFRYEKAGGPQEACNKIKVEISQLGEFKLPKEAMEHGKKGNTKHSGVFFKQEIPYIVRITQETSDGKEIIQEDLVFSPTESPVYFLPISESLFANKDATFVFTDGMVTSYQQDNKSELVALAGLPADLISGYFESIGNIFGQISTASTQEKSAVQSSLSLELAKMKNELCIAAIKANNTDAIKQLQCT